VTFLGHISAARVDEELATAKLVVAPSVWYEGFPLVLVQALALGTPAAVSAVGSLPQIVRDGVNGVVFAAGSSESLLRTVRAAWESPGRLEAMSGHARRDYLREYAEGSNYERLMGIYAMALDVQRARRVGEIAS
jgi:glycosyltransferase involved in cell wall biosynthesis